MHVRNCVFPNIVFQLENTTPLCSRANITVVSSSDILLQLYCKILDSFRVPVS